MYNLLYFESQIKKLFLNSFTNIHLLLLLAVMKIINRLPHKFLSL